MSSRKPDNLFAGNAASLPDAEVAAAGIVSHNSASAHLSNMNSAAAVSDRPAELGGRGGLEPTRYGDWEKNGRCIDF